MESGTVTSQFQLNTLAFGDSAGWGEWLIGHYRQHLAYVTVLATRATPIEINIQPILSIDGGETGLRFWLDAHANWHNDIRPYANVTGIDLSQVNFHNQWEFYGWVDLHNQEHAALDQAFGVA